MASVCTAFHLVPLITWGGLGLHRKRLTCLVNLLFCLPNCGRSKDLSLCLSLPPSISYMSFDFSHSKVKARNGNTTNGSHIYQWNPHNWLTQLTCAGPSLGLFGPWLENVSGFSDTLTHGCYFFNITGPYSGFDWRVLKMDLSCPLPVPYRVLTQPSRKKLIEFWKDWMKAIISNQTPWGVGDAWAVEQRY